MLAPAPIRRARRFVSRLAGTQGALLAIGVLMLMVSVTTVLSSELSSLPLRSALVPFGVIAAVLGLAGWFFVTKDIRWWAGFSLFVYAEIRSIAWVFEVADRTVGIGDWFKESSPVWVWQFPAVLGYLVWARARHEPHREGW